MSINSQGELRVLQTKRNGLILDFRMHSHVSLCTGLKLDGSNFYILNVSFLINLCFQLCP